MYLLIIKSGKSQSINKPLLNAKSLIYNGSIYVYGFKKTLSVINTLHFTCLKYNQKLNLIDSTDFEIGNDNVDNYLEIESDTIHNSLFFYFQQKNETNKLNVLRLDSNLNVITFSENVDANHLTTLNLSSQKSYYINDFVFTIKVSNDSISKQFYLNRYHLLSNSNKHEYKFDWQYPFERQHVEDIKIIHHDSTHIYLIALIDSGAKQGQWILKLNYANGQFVKAVKLNNKIDGNHYLINKCISNKKQKTLFLIGTLVTNNHINFETNVVNFNLLPSKSQISVTKIDSAFEIETRWINEIDYPSSLSKRLSKTASIHIKPSDVSYINLNTIKLTTDVYVLQNNKMSYMSSWILNLAQLNSDIEMSANEFYELPLLNEKNSELMRNNKDINTAADYYRFMTRYSASPISHHLINNSKPMYYFFKKNATKNTLIFETYYLGAKTIEKKHIAEYQSNEFVILYPLQKVIVFSRDQSQTSFHLNFF